LADAGASLITIHGRTYDQAFGGQADWAPIHALKAQLGVPVLGNGDVRDVEDGLARQGNLDGFMIGRAAIGNPWAFLPQGPRVPTQAERVRIIQLHYGLLRQTKPERPAILEFRKHLVGYLRGFALAKQARVSLLEAQDEAALLRMVEDLAQREAA
ncbi:MAG TPA: tRNA-dihydrouridine synthase, partial [bacterium]|nr:tRNA-dihydrouridine synthase [bacterium]